MNKFLLIAAFLFCFGTVGAKAEDLNMSIAAPQCFGTDFTNLTESMNNIIKCMNINAVNSEEGIEQINQRQDILNEFGANLYSLATAVRVKLDKDAKEGETSNKSTNGREITTNETQLQVKTITKRMDEIVKMESSIEVFEVLLMLTDLPYSEYGTGDDE